jgi:hypothetical protein
MAVSVLDLEQYHSIQSVQRMQPRTDPMLPLLGNHQMILMFLSLYDVNWCEFPKEPRPHPSQDDQRHSQMPLMIM